MAVGSSAEAPDAPADESAPIRVELALSVEDDLLVLARFTVSAVASRAGFDVEEIEDLRLAVDELCLVVLRGRRTGRLTLTLHAEPGCLDVLCRYEGAEAVDPDRTDEAAELSPLILDALVDEHGPVGGDGRDGAYLRRRRSPAGP